MSLRYNRNSNGPKIEPCGMPDLPGSHEKQDPLIFGNGRISSWQASERWWLEHIQLVYEGSVGNTVESLFDVKENTSDS